MELFFLFSTRRVFSKGTWKWAGYEVPFASISQLSPNVICGVNWYSFMGSILMNVELQLVSWLQSGYRLNDSVWLVSVLFGLCRYPTPEPMAENAPDVEHGESSHPNKEEKKLVPNPRKV